MANYFGRQKGPDSRQDSAYGNALNDTDRLYQKLAEQEKIINQLRTQLYDGFNKIQKSKLAELENMDKRSAANVNSYKEKLMLDYYLKTGKKVTEDAAAQEKIYEKVLIKISEEKRALLVEDFKEEQRLIAESQRANKRALADKSKSFKQYWNDRKKLAAQEQDEAKKTGDEMRKAGSSELEIMEATGQISAGAVQEAILSDKTLSSVGDAIVSNLKQMFDSTIQTYGTYQAKINTRLQGSGRSWQGSSTLGLLTGGLANGGIESNIKNLVGSNPYVKLQAVMDNVVKATEAGIANNVEQRAFLATVSENIAATFDAFDSNLMRVIRLQQADTTAARLGLEAGLTQFFNSNFLDNSYLNDAFDTVSENLIETTSQLSAEEAVAVEYNIQKWLGSLYSVGFSSTSVGKISQALGYLGSGNVSALASDSSMQSFLAMSASRAGLSYSDMLQDGIDSSSVNKLMRSMVEYLAEIANSDNKVVKSEYANIFGMSVSDLKAVSNVVSDIDTISQSVMSYGGAINELYSQMYQLTSRVSVAGMMQNLYDNVNYSIATGIASNPVTYALWNITSMIEDLTGGIHLPTFSVMGNMVDLNTTVTNLMRAGIVGVGSLGAIGSLISGISSTADPAYMLTKLGILRSGTATYNTRGSGFSRKSRQVQAQSSSTLVGNASGDDYYQQSLTSADDTVNTTIEQKKQESTDLTINNIHEYLVSVFDPKITEIERMVAALAGYSTSVSSWGDFQNDDNKKYAGTTVVVNYPNDEIETRQNNSATLNSIKQNTYNIYELLAKVISGESALYVKTLLSSSSSSTPGF